MLENVSKGLMRQYHSSHFACCCWIIIEIIPSYFKKMTIIFSSLPFYTKYVHLPEVDYATPIQIRHNLRFWPFFKDAVVVLDGIHILSSPPASERESF